MGVSASTRKRNINSQQQQKAALTLDMRPEVLDRDSREGRLFVGCFTSDVSQGSLNSSPVGGYDQKGYNSGGGGEETYLDININRSCNIESNDDCSFTGPFCMGLGGGSSKSVAGAAPSSRVDVDYTKGSGRGVDDSFERPTTPSWATAAQQLGDIHVRIPHNRILNISSSSLSSSPSSLSIFASKLHLSQQQPSQQPHFQNSCNIDMSSDADTGGRYFNNLNSINAYNPNSNTNENIKLRIVTGIDGTIGFAEKVSHTPDLNKALYSVTSLQSPHETIRNRSLPSGLNEPLYDALLERFKAGEVSMQLATDLKYIVFGNGNSAIHEAIRLKNELLVEYLINIGCDLTKTNAQGLSCVQLATESGDICILETILAAVQTPAVTPKSIFSMQTGCNNTPQSHQSTSGWSPTAGSDFEQLNSYSIGVASLCSTPTPQNASGNIKSSLGFATNTTAESLAESRDRVLFTGSSSHYQLSQPASPLASTQKKMLLSRGIRKMASRMLSVFLPSQFPRSRAAATAATTMAARTTGAVSIAKSQESKAINSADDENSNSIGTTSDDLVIDTNEC